MLMGHLTVYCVKDDEREVAFWLGVMTVILGAGDYLVIMSAVTHLLNPEYHALMDISQFAGSLK